MRLSLPAWIAGRSGRTRFAREIAVPIEGTVPIESIGMQKTQMRKAQMQRTQMQKMRMPLTGR